MNILVGGAWIYANGSIHIGHLAALLPGDVIARYHRLKGDTVCFVSGTDCHGTPITLRAKQEGIKPNDISEKYHRLISESFDYLGFSYDYYGKTTSKEHKNFVKDFHETLYKSEYIVEREEPQAYCKNCDKYLPDRLVIGICPICGGEARGDQCDECSTIYQPEELLDIRCSDCGYEPVFKISKHLYIEISKLKDELENLLEDNQNNWRHNAVAFTKRYIDEGLRDRAITRDLDWGIDVPKAGYEDKKLYIWVENVLGYLSTAQAWCENQGLSFNHFWNGNSRHYYIHGKDNIPFHSIILPALLLAHGGNYHLPDRLVSSEYLTLEGKKISTSKNHALWVEDLIGRYNPDALRYFFICNNPERKDSDFSWEEFFYANNSELLGIYGNFINRTLAFINKSFGGVVPEGTFNTSIKEELEVLYLAVGKDIEAGRLKKGLRKVIDFARFANKYFDEEKPWITAKTNRANCENTLHNCVQIIVNLSVLLEPFIPYSSQKVIKWFDLERQWHIQEIAIGYEIPEIEILFERLDKSIVEFERSKLNL